MTSIMNTAVEESFEYRHKKFDQFKRLRNDSSSSGDGYEFIKVEIERLEERPYSQTSSEISTAFTNTQWSSSEIYTSEATTPKRKYNTSLSDINYSDSAKRMRTTSSSDGSYSATFLPSNVNTLPYTQTSSEISSAYINAQRSSSEIYATQATAPKRKHTNLSSDSNYSDSKRYKVQPTTAKRMRITSSSDSSYSATFLPSNVNTLQYTQTSSKISTAYTNAQWSSSEIYATQATASKRKHTTSSSNNNYSDSKRYTAQPTTAKRMRTTSSSDSSYSATFLPSNANTLPYTQTSSEISPAYTNTQWSSSEIYATQATAPKRKHTTSSSDSNYSDSKRYKIPSTIAERMRTTSSSDSTYSASFLPSNVNTLPQTSTPFIVTADITSPAAVLPKISDETLRSICKYHGNMVRKFPKKERTPKDQERRDKNTVACRMSRRVKKLEHIAIEEQYKEFSEQTFQIIEQSIRASVYLHQLMKLAAAGTGNEEEVPSLETYTKLMNFDEKPLSSAGQKKSFTIAFLTGNEE